MTKKKDEMTPQQERERVALVASNHHAYGCHPPSIDVRNQFDEERSISYFEGHLAGQAVANERLSVAIRALKPLANIFEAFLKDNLDEYRPAWGDDKRDFEVMEIYSGRGGKQLLTVADAEKAYEALAEIAPFASSEIKLDTDDYNYDSGGFHG